MDDMPKHGYKYDTSLNCNVYFFEFADDVDCAYYPLVRVMRDRGFRPYPNQPQKFYAKQAAPDFELANQVLDLLRFL